MEKALKAMRPKSIICPCGARFTTVQGLGLHWAWNRRKGRDCTRKGGRR